MRRLTFLLLFSLIVSGLLAQDYPVYPSPVDIPIYLSATFAELRSNSFHAGVDIKTQGVEGKSVYAVADGYISRIGVSPYGYGNVIYITHNDGYTSVYAHLQRFKKEIADYVTNYQYNHQTFACNIYPSKDKFPIKVGDFIAYSGNSGGSGGPHLHFEIRHTESEKPVNPLFFGYDIDDDVRPNIKGIAVYPVGEESTVEKNDAPVYYGVESVKGGYKLKDKNIVYANGTIAFGVNTDDQVGSSTNKNGPYIYDLYLDDVLSFRFECDSFSYSEPKYVNSAIDYKRWKEKGNRYLRTDIDPYNRLSMYVVRRGTAYVEEGDTVAVRFEISDYAGNVSKASFTLVGTAPFEVEKKPLSRSTYLVKADGSLNSVVDIENFHISLEKETLFRDEWMKTGQDDPKGCCSRRYRFGQSSQTSFKLFTVSIKPDEKWKDHDKMFIAYYDESGKVSSLGGKMNASGYLEATTRSFGRYTIQIDSIAPVIKSVNVKENDTITSKNTLKFKITDDMTGIDFYSIYLNDEWVLGKYDAKNDLLYYDVDSHMKRGNNTVKVVVKDAVGNKKTVRYHVVRK